MKKRIVVVGVFVTSAVCLQMTAHQKELPTKESLKKAQQEQRHQKNKPSNHKNSPAKKNLTRNSPILAAAVTGGITGLFSLATYSAGCFTKKNYKEGNHFRTVAFGLATGLVGLITSVTGAMTALCIRKVITGPGIDD